MRITLKYEVLLIHMIIYNLIYTVISLLLYSDISKLFLLS